MPIVGADNNEFLKQLINAEPKFQGAAVTNPAVIGGVGASMAIKLLDGQTVPKWVKLTPQVWDNGRRRAEVDQGELLAEAAADVQLAAAQVKPWTTYTEKQLFELQGAVEGHDDRRRGARRPSHTACRPA